MNTVRTSLLSLATLALVASAATSCRSRDQMFDRERPGTISQSEKSRKDPNEQDRAGTTNLTGAAWVANGPAIDRIVASRCARELTCANVGPDKHFTTSDVCVLEVRKRMEGELSTSECPTGIDGKELDECLDAIRSESCSNPIETIGRLAACRTRDLCLRPEMPHR
jgi:hypothetical protein